MRLVSIGFVVMVCIVAVYAEEKPRPLDGVVGVLAKSDEVSVQRDILRGISEALAGRRKMTAPAGWATVHRKLIASKDAEVRERVMALSLLFGDPQALTSLRKVVSNSSGDAPARKRALETLLDNRVEGLPGLLRTLLDDKDLRRSALRGLARYGEVTTPGDILTRYAKFSAAEKSDAISTLTSRPKYALALLDAMEKKELPRADLSPFQAQQLLALGDKQVRERLNAVWGSIRPAAKDRIALTERYKKLATASQRKKANLGNGRAVWAKNCASCHMLFGEGSKIGPDLTGSQRANPEYILHKVLDPNAVVPRDSQVVYFLTNSGRVLTGLVKEETPKVVLLQTPTEQVRILKSDIDERKQLTTSLMPEGILATLTDAQVRDLLAYVGGKGQVGLPK